MSLPKSLTTVTTFSKLIALILFITFPFVGFYIGVEYQKNINNQTFIQESKYETTTCKNWETICDPAYPNDIEGCRPLKICSDSTPTPVQKKDICTTDAKQCPDGSYVGRTGPNCEFAACSK